MSHKTEPPVDEVWEGLNAISWVQPSTLGSIFDADLADICEGAAFERRLEFFRSRGVDPHYVSKTVHTVRNDDGTAGVRFAFQIHETVAGAELVYNCYHDDAPHPAVGLKWVDCEWTEIAR